ncbi:MAG: ZIP family metal transporter [Flavobacteriaceae bacterium]|nr:ZIP family metal transporter [Flavobacteriaceae bacterium]
MVLIAPFLAVLLSFFIANSLKPKNKNIIALSLSFSGAFLLSIIIFELLPKVYESADSKTIGLFIALGILLQIILEFLSKGAEHGHFHLDKKSNSIPVLLWISLSIHAFVEGIPLESDSGLLYAILIHKLVIAFILSMFLIDSQTSFVKSICLITVFALMTPLGSFTMEYLNAFPQLVLALNSLVIGVLLHISTVILFESSDGHKFNIKKILVIALGITIAYLFA